MRKVKMWWKPTKCVLMLCCLVMGIPNASYSASKLIIASNPSNGAQRTAFQKQINAFQAMNPEIKVVLQAFEHESFKDSVENNIASEKPIADVLFWFGGASLRHFADKGWLQDISDLWKDEGWSNVFSQSAKQAVTRKGQQFGLPVYYYQWGLYYRKSLFKKLNLAPPTSWNELLSVSKRLQQSGVTPFTLGSKNHWTAAGWFDYLNLRLNGLEFHLNLLNGCIKFTDPRVKNTLSHFKQLVAPGYFLNNAHQLDWESALPYLYHGKAAMLLMGNFFLASVPPKIRNDIGFFPFPTIDSNIPLYEDAPTDVLIVPSNSQNKENARRFLKFISQAPQQSQLAKDMNMIPTNQGADLASDEQTWQGARLLQEAEGLAQFFDRDAHPEFTKKALPLLSNFIRLNQEEASLQLNLELARKVVWPASHITKNDICNIPPN